jgi:hypothetical protein
VKNYIETSRVVMKLNFFAAPFLTKKQKHTYSKTQKEKENT